MPFFVEQEAFNRASHYLNVFETRQNKFLQDVHLEIQYPHRFLGESYRKAYKVIYDLSQTDLKKRYTFE